MGGGERGECESIMYCTSRCGSVVVLQHCIPVFQAFTVKPMQVKHTHQDSINEKPILQLLVATRLELTFIM